MSPPTVVSDAASVPLWGELRYGLELARLLGDRDFRSPERRTSAAPVLLVPGFMAGDQSLLVMTGWLRRRGSRTSSGGIRFNVGCAERGMPGIEERLHRLADLSGRPVVVVGQSRGGELGRVAAVRNPEHVSALVMLGSPVLDPLSVGPVVLSAVRSVARLGDLGMPGMFSSQCGNGSCCAAFRDDLHQPLPAQVRATAIYSRSDGIVSWEACLDPSATQVEVDSSHCGMSVNREVYRVLDEILDEEEARWSG